MEKSDRRVEIKDQYNKLAQLEELEKFRKLSTDLTVIKLQGASQFDNAQLKYPDVTQRFRVWLVKEIVTLKKETGIKNKMSKISPEPVKNQLSAQEIDRLISKAETLAGLGVNAEDILNSTLRDRKDYSE